MTPTILVAHPHRHHIFQLAAGCSLTGFDTTLCVPLYDVGLAKVISRLPGKVGQKARGYRSSQLNDAQIKSSALWQTWKLLSLAGGASDRSFFTNCYDRYIAYLIESARIAPNIFVSMQDYMPRSMMAAKRIGALVVSDQILDKSDIALKRLASCAADGGLHADMDQSVNQEILGECHAILAPSNAGIEAVRTYSPRAKHFITPYGVSGAFLAAYPPAQGGAVPIRVVARANTVRKGGVLLIRALGEVAEELMSIVGSPIDFILLGKPDSAVMAAMRRTRLPRDFTLKSGSIPHINMPRFYRSCSLFVMPSLSESRSLACLEAMASGLPCLVTPHVDVDELLDGSAGIVVNATVPAIAEGLRRAFTQRDIWTSWGKKGIAIAKVSSWERYQIAVANAITSAWQVHIQNR